MRTLFVVLIALGSLGLGGWYSRPYWQPWLVTAEQSDPPAAAHDLGHPDRVKLSPQARANLRLVVKPLQLASHQRRIQVPGEIVEQRGRCDIAVVAPVTGVVEAVTAFPGETVEPGDVLARLRITSETLQASQTELFKAAQEIRIATDQMKRLESAAEGGAVAFVKVQELRYQIERMGAARKAHRADLALRGLSAAQLDQVEAGEFLREIVIRVPDFKPPAPGDEPHHHWEIEELKVQPGVQLEAGQMLARLANHHHLLIEGRGFREDTPLIEKATLNAWPLQVTFLEERDTSWSPLDQPLTIRYLANNLDPTTHTFPFYVSLANQFREYRREGKTYRVWRFRTGQRVQLGVTVQEFQDVFVLPTAAVVREGPEAYVFRQNGDLFERKRVQVVFEDSQHVLLANDGSVRAGNHVAHNAAHALNRALLAQAEEGGGHHHHHHDH